MQVQDIFSLYEFLGELSSWGVVALLLLLYPIILSTLMFFIKGVSWKETSKNIFMIAVILLSTVSFTIITKDARSKKKLKVEATKLKSYLVNQKWERMSFGKIESKMKIDKVSLKTILNTFPNEFLEIGIPNEKNPEDSIGLELADVNALKKIREYQEYHLPFVKEKVKEYMISHNLKSISYGKVRKKIDVRFNDDFIEMMLTKYDTTFAPMNVKGEDNKRVRGLKLK